MEKKSINQTTPKVIAGVQSPTALNPHLKKMLAKKRKQQGDITYYLKGIQQGDKVILSPAITIIESTRPTDQKMAEDLTDYLAEHDVRVRYLHSDVDTVERVEILRDLRLGAFDVLVGINLLREGLDLPEVSLVAILDEQNVL